VVVRMNDFGPQQMKHQRTYGIPSRADLRDLRARQGDRLAELRQLAHPCDHAPFDLVGRVTARQPLKQVVDALSAGQVSQDELQEHLGTPHRQTPLSR